MKEEKKITLAEFGQSMLENFSMAEGDGGVKTVPEREKAKAGVLEPFMDSDGLHAMTLLFARFEGKWNRLLCG